MRSMSNSALSVAREAIEVAKKGLPLYTSPHSRKDYIVPQLFAALVLRQFFKTTYRGMQQLLLEWSDLRESVGLQKVPHWTTLEKAEKRLIKKGLSIDCFGASSSAPSNVA